MNRLDLDPDTWAHLSRLLDAALDLPADQRERWLAGLAPEHATLLPQLRDLLARAASVETSDFLQTLPKLQIDPDAPGEPTARGDRGGDIVGPYRLSRELGSGGMGSVWLAERTDGMVNRPVALKLPHGAWKRAGLAERMAREREILATLSHPHIARLYDAGIAADGQPYLAIEYVEGRPIDVYCREESLDVAARMRLFAQAARAVAYAHGKLIIHRDLKPANILVTHEGHVRLLDFGIAKLTEEGQTRETQLTALSGRALTPDYASPEQIRGEPLTVATDVYSLGVLLYELLTGVRPYRLKRDSRGALEDAILQADPQRPGDVAPAGLCKTLRGDPETIVLKALKKNPEERYATVHAFVDDIERYLERRPVLARPDSRSYRAARFMARNRLAVGATVAVAVAVMVGAGVALWQARVAVVQKERAEQVRDFIVSMFRDADPYGNAGRKQSADELLIEAHRSIQQRFEDRPDLRLELLTTIGSSLASLGNLDSAAAALQQALVEATRQYGADSIETFRARVLLLELSNSQRDTATLRRELDELLPAARRMEAAQPELLVRLLKIRADLEWEHGTPVEAEPPAREALVVASQRLGRHHPLAVAASTLIAETYLVDGRSQADMLAETQRALELALGAYQGRTDHVAVIRMRGVRGRALAVAGRFHEAVAEMQIALEGTQRALGESSLSAGYAMANTAPWYRRVGDLDTSLQLSNGALAIFDRSIDRQSSDYAFALITRGVTQVAARRPHEALADLAAAEATYTKLFGAIHWDTLTARFNRAVALAYLGRFSEARKALAPALDPATPISNRMWTAHVIGIVDRLEGAAAAAIARQKEAEELIVRDARIDWDMARVLAERGLAELDSGDVDAATATLSRAHSLYTKLSVHMHPARAEVIEALERIRSGRIRTAVRH